MSNFYSHREKLPAGERNLLKAERKAVRTSEVRRQLQGEEQWITEVYAKGKQRLVLSEGLISEGFLLLYSYVKI